jgi:NADPH-dependent F420 reductase
MDAIAILGGSGRQGRGLAERFSAAGLHVVVGSRDPERAGAALAASAHGSRLEVVDNATAVERCDVTVLAVPFASVDGLLSDLRDRFRERSIVIDLTVPVLFTGGTMSMAEVAEGSASEHIRALLPPHVQLAAAFKTIPADLLATPGAPLDCDEFVCADSDEARARAMELVALLPGLRPVDAGPLRRARHIEHLTALAIAINRRHKIHGARFRLVGLP